MNIWLVNPFDPLPGDPEQKGRYASLIRMLIARGHNVTWWTGSFEPSLQKNGQSRCNHNNLPADRTRYYLSECPRLFQKCRGWPGYGTIIVLPVNFHVAQPNIQIGPMSLSPVFPPALAVAVGRFARSINARFIVDIQDLWPETFLRLAPTIIQPLAKLILTPMQHTACKAYRLADAIVGVGDGYIERAVELTDSKAVTRTIPIGIDLTNFDAAVKAPSERVYQTAKRALVGLYRQP